MLVALVCTLVLAGGIGVAAEESPPRLPPPADQLGSLWFADESNPPAPAGIHKRITWAAPGALPATTDPEDPVADLPPGLPRAAYAPEPVLPEPSGWPFGDGFPRTSGTGRVTNGAFFWSDFLYDDNGAIGIPPPTNESTGAPSLGTYKYPEPAARGNGADIFRVAVGALPKGTGPHPKQSTVWRVDWNTLVDPTLPLAVFTVDSEPAAGVSGWPANAQLHSPGIDQAIIISGSRARVLDLVTGEALTGCAPDDEASAACDLVVDLDARSFIFRTDKVRSTGDAVLRVAAGLADETGMALRTSDAAHGALPSQPNVYNVAFRDYNDEPSAANTWYDSAQTNTLTTGGDVSAFAATINWNDIRSSVNAKHAQPEPLIPGYTNRWYVSSWPDAWGPDAKQGVAAQADISTSGDAAYLGRIQPYAVYVPTTYDPAAPAKLTLMLHGASSSHNSAQVHPRYIELACERRNSICLSPLGRGPNGGWRNEAELDVWETWNRVAAAYALDPDRTIISGISMGAFGTYKLAMDHPEAFAAAITIVGNATGSETALNRLPNLRWTPLYARHGTFDQLVPITSEIETQNELDRLQLRHVYDFQLIEDHVVVALKDAYDDIAAFMTHIDATHPRDKAPARIDYAWDAARARPAMGIDRPGAWWIENIAPRDRGSASQPARSFISGHSKNLDDPEYDIDDRTEPRVLASPSPAVRHVIDWIFRDQLRPKTNEAILQLTNVAAVTINLVEARLTAGATIHVTTDGPSTVTVGNIVHHVGPGTHTLDVP